FIDGPFLALVFGAAWAEQVKPRRGVLPLALLALAGLIRPEAWLMSGAYLVYIWRVDDFQRAVRLTALGLSAPLLWSLFDLACTGDPLYSLHGTQDLAELFQRPRGFSLLF